MLKSAMATVCGFVPTAVVVWAWNVPLPLPKRKPTLLLPKFATTRSSIPSWFMSAMATENGWAPTA